MVHPAVLLPRYNVHSGCVSAIVHVISPQGLNVCTVFPIGHGLVTPLLFIKEVSAEGMIFSKAVYAVNSHC